MMNITKKNYTDNNKKEKLTELIENCIAKEIPKPPRKNRETRHYNETPENIKRFKKIAKTSIN